MSDRLHPLQVLLGETMSDIKDVCAEQLSEAELEGLGTRGSVIIGQLSELSFELAMLVEGDHE